MVLPVAELKRPTGHGLRIPAVAVVPKQYPPASHGMHKRHIAALTEEEASHS